MRIRSSISVAISSRPKLTGPPASDTARRGYTLARTCSTSSFRKARPPPGRSIGRSRPRRTAVMNCFGLISDSRKASAGESKAVWDYVPTRDGSPPSPHDVRLTDITHEFADLPR